VFVEKRTAPIVSLAFGAVDSDVGEGARSARHTIATLLVADVGDVMCAPFVTSFTHILLRHSARHIRDHVIVSFHIIVQ
jgi:hypothetical protein